MRETNLGGDIGREDTAGIGMEAKAEMERFLAERQTSRSYSLSKILRCGQVFSPCEVPGSANLFQGTQAEHDESLQAAPLPSMTFLRRFH